MKRLVILSPNWLGDAVMALPAIADVHRGAPEVSITIAARSAVAPLFSMVPGVDETIVLPAPKLLRDVTGWRRLGGELAGRDFDTALLLPNSMQSALRASRAGIPQRWGYRTDWRGRLLTRPIAPMRGLHQVSSYQHLVNALGFANGPSEPRLSVSQGSHRAASDLLMQDGWDGRSPLVALAPGAAYGGAKRWPPEYFGELAQGLSKLDVRCVLVGSAADTAAAAAVARASGGAPLHNLVGRTDLPLLAGILTNCRTLVTNDSGAMHLAAAAGVSVTAVFGPTDDTATHPLGDAHAVLTNPVWCRPCMLRECPLDHACMRGVGARAVLTSARRAL